MTKPLAIDLFCGSLQPKLFLRAYLVIEKFVTGRTQYPKHVALRVIRGFVRSIPSIFGSVRNFQNARFSAALASGREVGILAAQSSEANVFVWAPRIVDFLYPRLLAMKLPALLPGGLARTVVGAIPLIGAWGCDVEMLPAPLAVCPRLCNVGLLPSSAAPRNTPTIRRAVKLVRSHGFEWGAANFANQIIHDAVIS